MATIVLNIPDAQVNRIMNAVCALNGYDPDSGLTKAQFTKKFLAQKLAEEVKAVEVQAAVNAARATTTATVDSELNIT